MVGTDEPSLGWGGSGESLFKAQECFIHAYLLFDVLV